MGQHPDAKTEVLAGLVERVTFHNLKDGFYVCGLGRVAIATWSRRWATRQ
jgi:hypothetical protein